MLVVTRIHEQGQFGKCTRFEIFQAQVSPHVNSISNLHFSSQPCSPCSLSHPICQLRQVTTRHCTSRDGITCTQLFHSSITRSDKCPHGKCHDSATYARFADSLRNQSVTTLPATCKKCGWWSLSPSESCATPWPLLRHKESCHT